MTLGQKVLPKCEEEISGDHDLALPPDVHSFLDLLQDLVVLDPVSYSLYKH